VPTSDAEPRDPFAGLADRLRGAAEAQSDRLAEAAERQRRKREQRQAEIERFVQHYPPPRTLRPIERDEWTDEVSRVAETAIPEDPSRASEPSEQDFEWMNDAKGSTFVALRAERVAALREEDADAVQRQNELAKELVRLRTPPTHSGTYPRRTRDQSKDPVIRPQITRAFTDDELERLSIHEMQQRVNEAKERVAEFEREVHSARILGPNGLGSLRVPILGGRPGTSSSGDSGLAIGSSQPGTGRSEPSSRRRNGDNDAHGHLPPPSPHMADAAAPQLECRTGAADGNGLPSAGGDATTEAIVEDRDRIAKERLRFKLGPANHSLREYHKKEKTGRQRVTVGELAKQVGLNPSYLSTRAKKLNLDLTPYLLLYGTPIYDPAMVIEEA
jgi:hypothetical protein